MEEDDSRRRRRETGRVNWNRRLKKKKKCRPPTDSSAMIERIARRLILGITLVFLAIFIFYSCLLPSEFESSLNRLLSERRR